MRTDRVDITITKRKPARVAQFTDEEAAQQIARYLANPGAAVVECLNEAPEPVVKRGRGRPRKVEAVR